MAWFPGWETVESTHWWSNFYFGASIVALIMLGVFEVISHRYSEREGDLAADELAKAQQHYDTEIARLHLASSEANERAAKLEKEAADARLEIVRLTSDRVIDIEKGERVIAKLFPYRGQSVSFDVAFDVESARLLKIVQSIFKDAGWVIIPPQRSHLRTEGAGVVWETGVRVTYTQDAPENIRELAGVVASAFNEEGIASLA
jgi:hypothetical protein